MTITGHIKDNVIPFVNAVPVVFLLISLAGFIVWKATESIASAWHPGQQGGPLARFLLALHRTVNRQRDANLGRGSAIWLSLSLLWHLAMSCLSLAGMAFLALFVAHLFDWV